MRFAAHDQDSAASSTGATSVLAAARGECSLTETFRLNVAARARAYEPEILLMREPFAPLDAQTRSELKDLRSACGLNRTSRHFSSVVTDDIDEAVYLGDRVVVLGASPWRVQEIVNVPVPAPCDQIATRTHPSFTQPRTHVLRAIRHGRPSGIDGPA